MTNLTPDFVDPWQLSRDHPEAYQTWQYLVANGETMRGFTEHLAHWAGLRIDENGPTLTPDELGALADLIRDEAGQPFAPDRDCGACGGWHAPGERCDLDDTPVCPHDCGMCDGQLAFVENAGGHTVWRCTECGAAHWSVDCCEPVTDG